MSYNILPKNNNELIIEPIISSFNYTIFKSISYFNLYSKKMNELTNYTNNIEAEQMYTLKNIIHNYNFVYNIIPEYKSSISKIKTKSSIFFDLIEIINNLNLIDTIKKSINFLHISEQHTDTVKATNYYNDEQENSVKQNFIFQDFDSIIIPDNLLIDLSFIEIKSTNTDILNPREYVVQLLKSLNVIIKQLKIGSTCIFKTEYLFYKPIIDFLFIISCMFEKIYVTKPTTSNVLSFEKYIICKNLTNKAIDISFYKEDFIKKMQDENNNIISFIDEDIPYYFINKLTEIDVMLGQYQLESIQEIINIINSKNKNDKIENLKKNNIQKGIMWCNKYKIPYNIFLEKKNAFLCNDDDNDNKQMSC